MKITYRQASRDDIMRQFRYYLLRQSVPEIAVRFKEAVRKTATAIKEQALAAPLYRLRNPQLQNLRSWPIASFEGIRLYLSSKRTPYA